MTAYKNFTVDLPERLMRLDKHFLPIAQGQDLEVTYLLMKLSTAFLLPYERIDGSSGTRASEISNPQNIRKYLELDKPFQRSSYCASPEKWRRINVDNFSRGPRFWKDQSSKKVQETVAKVLEMIRHATAHSNLYFGGESETIQHIYFGNRMERNKNTEKYTIIRCDIGALNFLVTAWIN
jgi:hypothetical protein